MKNIIVLSDTHGNLSAIEKLLPLMERCDYVFHLGDCFTDILPFSGQLGDKLIFVRGNCDMRSAQKQAVVEIEGKKILLTHGDDFGVKGGLTKLAYYAQETGCNAVFYGHTHQASLDEEEGIIYLNPGALALTKREKSFAFVTVTQDKILCKINTSYFR